TLGFSEAPLNAYSLLGGIFVLGMAYFPFVTLLTISGLKNIDSRYEEAALLQSSTFRTITRITVLRFVDKHHHGSVPASHQAGCYSKLQQSRLVHKR
ncbi:MAG: hypothetical protein ABFS56_31365, partial [Pseudomonadota bacterium]